MFIMAYWWKWNRKLSIINSKFSYAWRNEATHVLAKVSSLFIREVFTLISIFTSTN